MISSERVAEIAELYYEDVYRFCLLRLKKEEDAADVTQEVFLIFQKKHSGLEDDYIRSWLYKVADNIIKEHFKAVARREKEILYGTMHKLKASDDIPYEMEDDFGISPEEIDKKKKSVLDSLNEKELELFELVYTKHMKYKELAKALDISEQAVSSRVYRLKVKIMEKISFIFMAILLLFMRF